MLLVTSLGGQHSPEPVPDVVVLNPNSVEQRQDLLVEFFLAHARSWMARAVVFRATVVGIGPLAGARLLELPFARDRVSSLAISTLAADYQASRQATLRRLLELRMEPLEVVFFSWKLKPTETRQGQRDRRQQRMFGGSPGSSASTIRTSIPKKRSPDSTK